MQLRLRALQRLDRDLQLRALRKRLQAAASDPTALPEVRAAAEALHLLAELGIVPVDHFHDGGGVEPDGEWESASQGSPLNASFDPVLHAGVSGGAQVAIQARGFLEGSPIPEAPIPDAKADRAYGTMPEAALHRESNAIIAVLIDAITEQALAPDAVAALKAEVFAKTHPHELCSDDWHQAMDEHFEAQVKRFCSSELPPRLHAAYERSNEVLKGLGHGSGPDATAIRIASGNYTATRIFDALYNEALAQCAAHPTEVKSSERARTILKNSAPLIRELASGDAPSVHDLLNPILDTPREALPIQHEPFILTGSGADEALIFNPEWETEYRAIKGVWTDSGKLRTTGCPARFALGGRPPAIDRMLTTFLELISTPHPKALQLVENRK